MLPYRQPATNCAQLQLLNVSACIHGKRGDSVKAAVFLSIGPIALKAAACKRCRCTTRHQYSAAPAATAAESTATAIRRCQHQQQLTRYDAHRCYMTYAIVRRMLPPPPTPRCLDGDRVTGPLQQPSSIRASSSSSSSLKPPNDRPTERAHTHRHFPVRCGRPATGPD